MRSPLAVLQLVLPKLRVHDGTVIDISSAMTPYQGWGGYGASKAALDPLTAVFAAENPRLPRLRLRPWRYHNGVANGINSISRTVGSALGSAVITTLLTAKPLPHPPLPQESQFTVALRVGAGACVVTVAAALLGLRPQTRSATTEPSTSQLVGAAGLGQCPIASIEVSVEPDTVSVAVDSMPDRDPDAQSTPGR